MKKALLAAFATAVLLFVLLFFLFPVRYTYTIPWSCPALPGFHSCPYAVLDKNGHAKALAAGKGPLIGGFHKDGGFPRLVYGRSVIRNDGFAALFAGLLAYEVMDKYHAKSQHKKPKKKLR